MAASVDLADYHFMKYVYLCIGLEDNSGCMRESL